MSAKGSKSSGDILGSMLLRSSTPGPNEKVLDYLEGMSRDDVDNEPPRSIVDDEEYQSRSRDPSRVQSPSKSHHSDPLQELANSHVSSYGHNNHQEDDEDIASDVQERSQNGEEILHIPGPQDPPGPRYESYDSGPSFGNMGPLPEDYSANPAPVFNNTWNPPWDQGPPKPAVPWNLTTNGGVTPGQPYRVPLPESVASPRAASVAIGVESPSSKSTRNRIAPSGASSSPKVGPNSPRSTAKPDPIPAEYRPLSPQSTQSRVTGRTRPTEKGTIYPSLPESRVGEEDMPLSPVSPTRTKPPSKAASKAASVSPSDSQSQYKARSAAKSRRDGSKINGSETGGETAPRVNGKARSPPNGSSASHQSRPFSPYRHAATTEDLLHAVVRGRVVTIPEGSTEEPSHHSEAPAAPPSEVPARSVVKSKASSRRTKTASAAASQPDKKRDADATPTPSRPNSPGALNQEETEVVKAVLASAAQTPRTSYYEASVLEPDVANSYFHDKDLCVLFQFLNDNSTPEVVKKVMRKAVRKRVKDLGMKHDNESIRQLQKNHQGHGFSGTQEVDSEEPPKWAADLKREIVLMQQRIESLGPKIENLRAPPSPEPEGEEEEYGTTPVTQTVNIHTQPTGTMADSTYQPHTEVVMDDDEDINQHDNLPEQEYEEPARRFPHLDGEANDYYNNDRDDSPGQQFLVEELYKLRQKPAGSQSGLSHHSWELHQDDEQYDDEDNQQAAAPTIPGSDTGYDNEAPLPPIPAQSSRSIVTTPQPTYGDDNYSSSDNGLLPWQRIHQRLLSWAIVWPLSEFDGALASTMRGRQVNEVAMSIWSTQTYKRYVRSRLTDNPQMPVDRLFVPPNMADAINNAVFHGRHGDACGMLRDLWTPFGLQGMPRLLVVLAKHRSDENHWVVHRFSLPEGLLTTYDSYPEKTLPDGRPLGWWFAIRVAWPTALYPNPDHLIQKMVRLHRPMQRSVDNSVAAGGIWRNVLMGSRPERSLDLERLRDLINTEVKNLRQRKQVGKLAISPPQPAWEDMN